MDEALEPDVGTVSPEPVLPVGRVAMEGPQADPVSEVPVAVSQLLLDVDPAGGGQELVGVDVEDPLAARPVEAGVASGGKVLVPGPVDDHGPEGGRDLPAPIGRSRVHDDDLVDHRSDRGEQRVSASASFLTMSAALSSGRVGVTTCGAPPEG